MTAPPASEQPDVTEKKSLKARAKGLSDHGQRKLIETRAARSSVDTACAVYERDRDRNGGLLAGAVAFRAFTLVLPISLVLVTVAGVLVATKTGDTDAAIKALGVTGSLFESIKAAVNEAGRAWWLSLASAVFASIIVGLPTLRTLRAAHSVAWGQPIPPKISVIKGVLALLGIGTALMLTGTLLQSIRDRSSTSIVGMLVLSLLVHFGAWLGASILLPHGDAPWTSLIPGALLFAVGLQGLEIIVAVYLTPQIQSSKELYGPVGLALVIIGGLYMLARLIVAAAELNATLWERRQTIDSVLSAAADSSVESEAITRW